MTQQKATAKAAKIRSGWLHLLQRHPKAIRILPVLTVAAVGTGVLLFAKAATVASSFEAESGVRNGGSLFTDSNASGNFAVRFNQTISGGVSCPAISGVTCQDIDGGANYYAKWSNSFTTDPSFFPLAVFNQDDTAAFPKYKANGINGIVGFYNGTTDEKINVLKSNGMWAMSMDGPPAKSSYGNTFAAYHWFDEADGNNRCDDIPVSGVSCTPTGDGRTPASAIAAVTTKLAQSDPTRPSYGQYTKPVAINQGLSDSQAAAYVNAVDIVSFDYYTITDGWQKNEDPWNNDVWKQYDAVKNVRRLANYKKPVWPFIEMMLPFEKSQ